MSLRQVVLDTETTGLEVSEGHRVIEVGCVELRDRRITDNSFHHYLNPERDIDAGAQAVHGISRDQLVDKPRFADIAEGLVEYLRGAELLIHNAEFDVGFLDDELRRAGHREDIRALCTVTDTVALARSLHPGQKNNLNALCRRYDVDHTDRALHGALLDARLLAEVYLAMTGGQESLALEPGSAPEPGRPAAGRPAIGSGPLPVVRATGAELEVHRARLKVIADVSKERRWATDLPE